VIAINVVAPPSGLMTGSMPRRVPSRSDQAEAKSKFIVVAAIF
jgi:hypothetical protein